jgi:acyl-coenzyme A synthetase/AMP-(fatty) acid ligase
MQYDLVLESAVVQVADEFGISKCKAYVVLRREILPSESLARELQLFVKERLAPFKRPHHVEFSTGAADDRERQDPTLQTSHESCQVNPVK